MPNVGKLEVNMEEKVATKKERKSWVARFKDPSFKISKKGKWYAIFPAIIIVLGLIIALTVGMNLGLDFTGGQIWSVTGIETDRTNVSTVQNVARTELGGRATATGRTDTIEIRFNLSDSSTENLATVTESLRVALETAFPSPDYNIVIGDPTFTTAAQSADRIMTTIIAIVAALGAILLYMLFRFKFTSGVAATIGLLHDVLVMFALTIIFQVQINAAFIAAFITVIGYSLNSTLILFDRIRNMEKNNEKRLTTEMLVDQAVKDTFGRTMNTIITTLVPIFVLIVAGVPAIREFALPIFFGLIAGVFSTIFLTTSLYTRFETAKRLKISQQKKYLPQKQSAKKSETA